MVIMGSGIGYGPAPSGCARHWDVAAVRGPLSAKCLGLAPDKAITDGAMLLSLLPEYWPSPRSRSGTLFIPHYMTVDGGAWAQACAIAGVEFVDPRSDSRAILAKIQSAELVIAGAMHGAIVADVLRTPWLSTTFDPRSGSFKWNDWCLSMQIDHRPHALPASTLCERVRNWALPSGGYRLPHAAQGIETLAHAYRRANRAAAHSVTTVYRKIATRAAHAIATQFGAIEQRFAPGRSPRRVSEAAMALNALTSVTPMLSHDSVYHQQRERMAVALRGTAGRYGLTLREGLAL